jgi:kynureninase
MNFDARIEAQHLDRSDPLARFRSEFVITEPDLVYLDGNSLGRLALCSARKVREVVENGWGEELVRGWGAGWWQAPGRVGDKIGRLIGAAEGEVIVTDSTSVNLFKLMMAAVSHQKGRTVLISDDMNFPSDLYVLQGCAKLAGEGHVLQIVPSFDGISMDVSHLENAIDHRTAVVCLSHIAFKSGYLYDIQNVTDMAHQAGALVVWDLCHSVGAAPVDLDAWGVDLAVGCTYKYLNGGPGSPAFLFIHKELQDRLVSPIWGWFGQRTPFDFDLQYTPANGIQRFMGGSPPILSMMALEAALDLPLEASTTAIRKKSEAMTAFAIRLLEQTLAPLGFTLGSPAVPERRGSHISICHPDAYRINRALIEEMKVIPDFRAPDNIRLGFAPLYTSFEEIWQGFDRIRQVVEEQRFRNYGYERAVVT